MTDLTKAIRRRTELPRGKFVVTLYPEGVIGFRKEKTRTEYRLPLARVFVWAAEATIKLRPKRKRIVTRLPR